MQQWNQVFKKQGRFFTKINENLPVVAKAFKKQKVKKILDLGCGSGRHSVYLAKRGFELYGYDIAAAGIKIAKEWLRENKLKADFRVGDIYKRLPYADNFFDAVISTNTIHHAKIENIRKVIKEMERVLKPGGLIFINCRKRAFQKSWFKNGVSESTWENKFTPFKIIAPRTYVPTIGKEKGLAHYLFNKEQSKKNSKILRI